MNEATGLREALEDVLLILGDPAAYHEDDRTEVAHAVGRVKRALGLAPPRSKATPLGALMRPELGTRTGEVLAFIERFIGQRGFAPTVAEIGAVLGMTSRGHVTYHLRKLEAAGRIERVKGRARTIKVIAARTR